MTDEKNGSSENDPDEKNDLSKDNDGFDSDQSNRSFRRRRRIKVRKRVRVKKKISPQKKAKKILETVIWICVITVFVVTLIILFIEMDIKSAKNPSKKTSYLMSPSSLNFSMENAQILKS